MGAEASAARAEVAARLRYRPAGDVEGPRFRGDVGDPGHLARLAAFERERFAYDQEEVALRPHLVARELGDLHAEEGKGRVRADRRRHVEPRDLRIVQVGVVRLLPA